MKLRNYLERFIDKAKAEVKLRKPIFDYWRIREHLNSATTKIFVVDEWKLQSSTMKLIYSTKNADRFYTTSQMPETRLVSFLPIKTYK